MPIANPKLSSRISAVRLLAALAWWGLAASSLTGCHSHKGSFTHITVPLTTYVRSQLAANGAEGRLIDFPTVQVYNHAGILLYRSHDVAQNSSLLEDLPSEAGRFSVIPGARHLSDAVANLPGLDQNKISRLNGSTIVIISLDGCQGCTVLDATVEETQERLLNLGNNLILLTVKSPADR